MTWDLFLKLILATLDCATPKERSNRSHSVFGRHHIHQRCTVCFSLLDQRDRIDLSGLLKISFVAINLGVRSVVVSLWLESKCFSIGLHTTNPHLLWIGKSHFLDCQYNRRTDRLSFRELAIHVSLLAMAQAFPTDRSKSMSPLWSWSSKNHSAAEHHHDPQKGTFDCREQWQMFGTCS